MNSVLRGVAGGLLLFGCIAVFDFVVSRSITGHGPDFHRPSTGDVYSYLGADPWCEYSRAKIIERRDGYFLVGRYSNGTFSRIEVESATFFPPGTMHQWVRDPYAGKCAP